MPTPGTGQFAAKQLEFVRGWFDINAVAFSAKLSSSVTVALGQGRCVSLNASGEFVTGCLGRQMPMWLMTATDAEDVATSDAGQNYVIGKPTGELTAITAKHACELATTEFDTAQTYVPNEFLRAINADTNATTGGRMTNQGVVYITNTPLNWTAVVGRVSKAAAKRDSTRNLVLRFWPADNLPGASGL